MLKIILRRLLRRFIRSLVLKGALLLVALVALLGGGLFAARALAPGGGSDLALQLPGSRQAPPATEAFLKGNQAYDADLIWNAYGEEARERLRSRGGSLEELRRQLTAGRERGNKIEEIVYVGGQQLQNGTSMHFYLVRLVTGQTQGQREYIPYVFTLDASGKIARVQ